MPRDLKDLEDLEGCIVVPLIAVVERKTAAAPSGCSRKRAGCSEQQGKRIAGHVRYVHLQ